MASFQSKLHGAQARNDSLVCVGLDSDPRRLPKHLGGDVFAFNQAIIDATADLVSCFKPNSAFYEAQGDKGLAALKRTCDYIRQRHPQIPIIIDAKRADIGSTNEAYAQFVFEWLGADALTVHPYLGEEAVEAFLEYKDKGIIVLCRTSNPGAKEFQDLEVEGLPLYQVVAKKVSHGWNKHNNCLLVVGATYPDELRQVRQIVGQDMDLLVPGIGAQGGDLAKTLAAGINAKGEGLIISSTRDIIYASAAKDFAEAARAKADELRASINLNRRS